MTTHPFDNSYARLPDRFFARVSPTRVAAPRLIRLNAPLAGELGLDVDRLSSTDGAAALAGNGALNGTEPIATAYAGHQFGSFVPQLGDGRAILLGEVVDGQGGRRDIQLKGAGRTPFSRGGDGRAAIGPVLREYLASESMAALGIRTTRALAAVGTGERVMRETMLPGAVLTRVASSHIRVGTFEFFASRGDVEGLRILADHVIARHYPEAAAAEGHYRALLDAVIRAQADLVADWLRVGFIHGVMNTDNMSVAGETIDYGPCAFMDEYDPLKVFSSIDRHGRYAYGRQPGIAEWNLTQLATCLLPLLANDQDAAVADANAALDAFGPRFDDAYRRAFRRKIGLFTDREGDDALVGQLLELMTANQADFTLTFRRLSAVAAPEASDDALADLFQDRDGLGSWTTRWRQRLTDDAMSERERADAMRAVNPAFIPRNHRVEEMIQAAATRNDFTMFEQMLDVCSRPFDDQPEHARFAEPPLVHERVRATFCGT